MKIVKQDKGHTLIELLIVIALVGIVFVGLFTVMLSVNRTYVRADKKAQNLEEARLIINHITDNFQSYEKCQVLVKGSGGTVELTQAVPVADLKLDSEGFSTVETVFFTNDLTPSGSPPSLPAPDPNQTIQMSYVETVEAIPPPAPGVHPEGELTWQKKTTVGISEISFFKVKRDQELLEFKVGVIQKGHGVVADQTLEVGTTLSLKYKAGD